MVGALIYFGPGDDTRLPEPDPPRPQRTFCERHPCTDDFYSGKGTIVQCTDGVYSHSGGRPGACSHHGGVRDFFDD
jgi:hypothetical protein